jgi:outer membrane protein assembly factor BamB
MASFEILLGGRHGRRAASDAVEIRAPHVGERAAIDILVDGANVSARTAPDDPVAVVGGLVRGVDVLCRGRATSARIPFYEGPWELYLARRGPDALVTFVRAGASPEVIVKDRPVPLKCIAQAAVRAALRLDRGAANVSGLVAAAERALRLASGLADASNGPVTVRVVHTGAWSRAPADVALAFGLSVVLPESEVGSEADLYPLLVSGELVAWHRGKKHRIAQGLPLLYVDRLVRATRATIEAYERRRPSHVRLSGDGLLLSARLGNNGDVEVTFAGSGRKEPLVIGGLGLRDLARATHALARSFRRAISGGSPSMRRSFRVAELCGEARRLAYSARDLAGPSSVACADPEAYRGRIEPEPEDLGGPTLGGVRRIRFVERWRLEADGLDLDSTFPCGDRVVVTTRAEVLAVHRDAGDLLWRRMLPPALVSLQARGAGLARVLADGRVVLHSYDDGEERWAAILQPRAGAPPFAVAAVPPDAPPVLLVAEGLRRLTALDLRTGERRWRFTARRGGTFRACTAGVLTYVVSGDSALSALETATGHLAWRLAERARFSVPPLVMREAVIAASSLGDDATVVAGVEAASGKLLWRRIVEGRVLGAPMRLGAACALRLTAGAGTAVLVLDPATGSTAWRGILGAAPDDVRVVAVQAGLFASTATGHVLSLDPASGRERWRTHLPLQSGRPAPHLPRLRARGDVLFVGSDAVHLLSPADGKLVHRFGDDSPVPDRLHVDERGGVYACEEGGTLACYALGPALRLV